VRVRLRSPRLASTLASNGSGHEKLPPAPITIVSAVTPEQLIDQNPWRLETGQKRAIGVSLKRIFMHRHQMWCCPGRPDGSKSLYCASPQAVYTGCCKRTSENSPSETVWKVQMGFALGSHELEKTGREVPLSPRCATENTRFRLLQLFSKRFLSVARRSRKRMLLSPPARPRSTPIATTALPFSVSIRPKGMVCAELGFHALG
jgi:hypothetical protein